MSQNNKDAYVYSASGLYAHPFSGLILKWFDPRGYLEFNPDLRVLLEHEYDYEALCYHFVNTGFHEKRIYNPQLLRSFNANYYRNFLSKKVAALPDDVLNAHWIYEGIFNGYAASANTDAAMSSPFQLFNIGRVGSYSIASALERCGFKNVIHTHSDYEFSRSYSGSNLTFSQMMEVRFGLDSRPPLFIISGVREPLGWATSSIGRFIDQAGLARITQTADVMHARINYALNFFGNPVFARFNIYENGFNAEEGYTLYKFGRHRLLIYRVDKLSGISGVIANMIGRTDFKIDNMNSSSDAALRSAGAAMKKLVDANLVEAIRNSVYFQNFFTHSEQEKYFGEVGNA